VKKAISALVWFCIALLGAFAYAAIAFKRGEPLNSGYILAAALCTYAIGYRFYSKWIAAKVLMLDDRRATPCEIHEDGRDFVKTNKWIVFGHHFAAISGPGPLVGPVLAAQFGYLPGTLWILIGVVLGGAVQDFIILAASMRRDGRSLGQMLKDELSKGAGAVGTVAILAIMIILLAVLALVVVNALADSPWGVFTVAATVPIAMFMGGYLRWLRVGKVLEASVIGVVLLLAAVWGGQLVAESASLKPIFKLAPETLAWSVIVYGFAASVLPVWLLLAPRDYLSTFMKLGTIFALALGTLLILPELRMPAISTFIDGSGPVVPGKLFPFCFITIACGAISGFHTLISSGVTPKIIARERHARSVGYGAMCLESLVAIMAIIAACTLEPGVYLSVNMKGTATEVVAKASSFGPEYAVTEPQMTALAATVKEDSLIGRTGGAATLALGMAQLFARLPFFGGNWLGIWYHFALMFEALFILTTLDAGTRVGRYMLQDALGNVNRWLGDVKNTFSGVVASAFVVALWGWFLIGGVRDPDGGIKALWPIFGIANQLLASIALCLGTTILLKTGLRRNPARPALALVTLLPLVWLLTVTGAAAVQKIWHEKPSIGFLAKAADIAAKDIPKAEAALAATDAGDLTALKKAQAALRSAQAQRANMNLNAVVTGTFLVLVVIIVGLSVREWLRLLGGAREPNLSETAPVWLPAEVASASPSPAMGAVALGALLLKELSGEAAIDRERVVQACECAKDPAKARRNVFLSATERQFRSPNRCC
jgi:carbon starvation protein